MGNQILLELSLPLLEMIPLEERKDETDFIQAASATALRAGSEATTAEKKTSAIVQETSGTKIPVKKEKLAGLRRQICPIPLEGMEDMSIVHFVVGKKAQKKEGKTQAKRFLIGVKSASVDLQVRSLECLFPSEERYALQTQQAQPKQKMATNLAFLVIGICTRRMIQIGTERRQKSDTNTNRHPHQYCLI